MRSWRRQISLDVPYFLTDGRDEDLHPVEECVEEANETLQPETRLRTSMDRAPPWIAGDQQGTTTPPLSAVTGCSCLEEALTGQSSSISWSETEAEGKDSLRLHQLLTEFDECLYDNTCSRHVSNHPHGEVEHWREAFSHLRVSGRRVVFNGGAAVGPDNTPVFSSPIPRSSVVVALRQLEKRRASLLTLQLQGSQLRPRPLSRRDSASNETSFYEEILETDGVLEEIIAENRTTPRRCDSSKEDSQQTPLNELLANELFNQVWAETVPYLKELTTHLVNNRFHSRRTLEEALTNDPASQGRLLGSTMRADNMSRLPYNHQPAPRTLSSSGSILTDVDVGSFMTIRSLLPNQRLPSAAPTVRTLESSSSPWDSRGFTPQFSASRLAHRDISQWNQPARMPKRPEFGRSPSRCGLTGPSGNTSFSNTVLPSLGRISSLSHTHTSHERTAELNMNEMSDVDSVAVRGTSISLKTVVLPPVVLSKLEDKDPTLQAGLRNASRISSAVSDISIFPLRKVEQRTKVLPLLTRAKSVRSRNAVIQPKNKDENPPAVQGRRLGQSLLGTTSFHPSKLSRTGLQLS